MLVKKIKTSLVYPDVLLIQTHLHIVVWPFCPCFKPFETMTISKTSSLRFWYYKWNVLNYKKSENYFLLVQIHTFICHQELLEFVCYTDIPPLFFCFRCWHGKFYLVVIPHQNKNKWDLLEIYDFYLRSLMERIKTILQI